jgi:hypothetical protein
MISIGTAEAQVKLQSRSSRAQPLGSERFGEPTCPTSYSITSSAIASSVGGTSIPSARAVCMLMTNSNLVGCCTGRSAGLTPGLAAQSALMLAARITSPHFSVSAAMSL